MQDRALLIVKVSGSDGTELTRAKVVASDQDKKEIVLSYDPKAKAYTASLPPQRYSLQVSADDYEPEQRTVEVGPGRTEEVFVLGRAGNPFYRRGRVRVPFEPRRDLIAVSLAGDGDQTAERRLNDAAGRLGLQPIDLPELIRNELVRVFRLPGELLGEERAGIHRALRELSEVRYVGDLVTLNDLTAAFITDEIVVIFEPTLERAAAERTVREIGESLVRWLPYSPNSAVVRLDAGGYAALDTCEALMSRPGVASVEPNIVSTAVDDFTPDDFLLGSQPHLDLIQAEAAWDISMGSPDIVLAVVDSGCDIDHPDFNSPGKVYQPFDFVSMDSDPTAGSHGTKSSGIATAVADNAEGVAGVAPGCRLMPIRRPSGGTDTDYADMYVWLAGLDPGSATAGFPAVISPGADVISNSFGIYQNAISAVMQNALDTITNNGRGGRGCVVVFSVGNDNQDFTVAPARQWAAYNRTIAVASSAISPPDAAEVKVSTSNFGPSVDICAPGGGPAGGTEARTLSTTNVGEGDTAGSASASTNDYDDFGQTSCAAPQVAGAAALLLSVRPDLTWTEVRDLLRASADRIDVGNTNATGQWVDNDLDGFAEFSQWYGFGRLNVREALCQAIAEIEILTPSLQFIDVIAGETTPRAVRVRVCACDPVTVAITGGPVLLTGSGTFGTALDTSITVSDTGPECRDVFLWVTFTGENDGDTATGEVTITAGPQVQTIPITCTVIGRPTAVVALALDRSGSMGFNSGFPAPFNTRAAVLKYSVAPVPDVLQDDHAIGMVAFDQDPHDIMPVEVAGPLVFGAGRNAARAAISGYTHNPAGATAIGDGLEHAHDLLAPETSYDVRATIVFTDGHETAAQYISDVDELIDERVYAVGLGTADEIQPTALTALTNGTGGYLLLTGEMDEDDYFLLAKYFLQVLAGVTNEDIVLDPAGAVGPGQVHRIPFRLNEQDITVDVLLLAEEPRAVRFWLETPEGARIDPGSAAGLGVAFGSSDAVSIYRFALPVTIDGGAQSGVWHAVLELDEKYWRRALAKLERYPETYRRRLTHGVRYSLNVHTWSNLRLRASLSQSHYEPGAELRIRALLTEAGIPLEGRASVVAELVRPDGTHGQFAMSEFEPGNYEAIAATTISGVYRFRVLADGRTRRGTRFTREQLATGQVWRGGNQPPPSSPPTTEPGLDVCSLIECLFSDDVMSDRFVKRLLELGIDVETLRKCLRRLCKPHVSERDQLTNEARRIIQQAAVALDSLAKQG